MAPFRASSLSLLITLALAGRSKLSHAIPPPERRHRICGPEWAIPRASSSKGTITADSRQPPMAWLALVYHDLTNGEVCIQKLASTKSIEACCLECQWKTMDNSCHWRC
ncbi:hypothetical protein JOM56_011053 [Amanita muscaria]